MGLKYEYSKESMQKEIENINSSKGSYLYFSKRNKVVLTYQYPLFYEKEIDIYSSDPLLRRKLIENRVKYLFKEEHQLNDKELLRGFKISGIYRGFSHFNPLIIKKFIEDYKITSIYDPFGGWGHRLVGSGNIKYIFNDIDERVCDNIRKIIKDFDIPNKVVYNCDASKFKPEEDYESVFTCPPYFNKEEYKYNLKIDDKQVWFNLFENCFKKSLHVKYFGIVFLEEYKENFIEIFNKYNFKLEKEILLKRNMGHFNKYRINKSGECLFVFIRGNLI